ncbi:MAG: hypothetical protein FJZ01_01980 [Candidatus Sericytochromatia bacterium]|nr:hypothetical protein [Candidatus Tanganyikabacteria bacterium]
MKANIALNLGIAAAVAALSASALAVPGCVAVVPGAATDRAGGVFHIQGPTPDGGNVAMTLPGSRGLLMAGQLARVELLFRFADGTTLPRSINDSQRLAGEQFAVEVTGVPEGPVGVAITLLDADEGVLGTGTGAGMVKAGARTTVDVEIFVNTPTGDVLVRGRVTRDSRPPSVAIGTPQPGASDAGGGAFAQPATIADVKILAGRYAIKAQAKVRGNAFPDAVGLLDRSLKVELLKKYRRLKLSVAVDDAAPADKRARPFQLKDPAGNLLADGTLQRLDAALPVVVDVSRYDWIELLLPRVDYDWDFLPFEEVRFGGIRFER